MSRRDIVWYGRAFVWIGCALLLLMAFTGKQIGFVSVVSVLGAMIGVCLLMYAIPRRANRPRVGEGEVDPDV